MNDRRRGERRWASTEGGPAELGPDAAKAPLRVPSREQVGRRIPIPTLWNQLAGTGPSVISSQMSAGCQSPTTVSSGNCPVETQITIKTCEIHEFHRSTGGAPIKVVGSVNTCSADSSIRLTDGGRQKPQPIHRARLIAPTAVSSRADRRCRPARPMGRNRPGRTRHTSVNGPDKWPVHGGSAAS